MNNKWRVVERRCSKVEQGVTYFETRVLVIQTGDFLETDKLIASGSLMQCLIHKNDTFNILLDEEKAIIKKNLKRTDISVYTGKIADCLEVARQANS